jgi:hypothetical protein
MRNGRQRTTVFTPMRRSIGFGVAGVLLALTAPVEAKYNPCVSGGIRGLVPGSLPRNARLWLSNGDPGSGRYRVRGKHLDRLVVADRSSRFIDLGVLEPNETYEVRDAHWDWTLAWFTTNSDEDHAPPRMPLIRSLSVVHLSDLDHSTADDVDREGFAFDRHLSANEIRPDLELSADTMFLDITIYDPANTAAFHTVMWREDLSLLGRTACGRQVHLRAGTSSCMVIRAIDLAGNISAPAIRCATVTDAPGETARAAKPLFQFPAASKLRAHRPRWWWMLLVAATACVVRPRLRVADHWI